MNIKCSTGKTLNQFENFDAEDAGENFPKKDVSKLTENKNGGFDQHSSTAVPEISHYQMVGENVVYEEAGDSKVSNDMFEGNLI